MAIPPFIAKAYDVQLIHNIVLFGFNKGFQLIALFISSFDIHVWKFNTVLELDGITDNV